MGSETIFECLEVEKTLGWRVFKLGKNERVKTVSENDLREIVQAKTGKHIYILKNTPELSLEESKLLKKVLEEYRNKASMGAEITPKETFGKYCEEKLVHLEKDQEEYLKKILDNMIAPEGILSELLEDQNLEEIAVIGLGKTKPVYVFDTTFGWLPTNLYFSSSEEIKNITNAMAGTIGRRITLQKPRLNAVLKDGSRLNACIEPASVSGPSITIRKFRKNPFTPTELAELNSASLEQMAFLWTAIQADCSILVCGNTGSGKTTLLNSLLNFVPANERIILVEETPEINTPHKHFVKLASVEGLDIGMQDLIINTLRMRPDRVIVGEVRDKEELKAFMDTLLAGQGKGCYATFHAQSGKEALARMQNLGAMEMDLSSIDIIITQKRWSSYNRGMAIEERKLIEISEPIIEKNHAGVRNIFSYNFEKNVFEKKKESKNVYEKISRAFKLKKNGIGKELKSRAMFLGKLRGKTQEEFFNEIQNYGKS